MPHRVESRPQRVLLVPVESVNWQRAQDWSYTLGFAHEEGLKANGVECTVLPALEGFPSLSPRSWLYHAPRLLAGRTFDQAWIWLNDDVQDAVFFDWLATVAPVRVGVIGWSLEYTAHELREAPDLLARRDTIDQQLRTLTHALAVDEHDAWSIRQRVGMPAAWLPCSVPARVAAATALPGGSSEVRVGQRDASLEARGGADVTNSNADADWPAQYDALQREMVAFLPTGKATAASLDRYVTSLRTVRRALFARTIATLRNRAISVHSPSALKAYCPSVVESMAAGVPVVSWDIPHRPRNRSLFTPNREIRLFDRHDRATQERHLRELRANPEIARAQATAARDAVARHHTIEARVARILDWIETGAPGEEESVDMPAESANKLDRGILNGASESLEAATAPDVAVSTGRAAARGDASGDMPAESASSLARGILSGASASLEAATAPDVAVSTGRAAARGDASGDMPVESSGNQDRGVLSCASASLDAASAQERVVSTCAAASRDGVRGDATPGLFLPEGYERRDASVVSTDRGPASRSGAYDLAARLAAALGCTRLVDVGGAEPASAIELSSSLSVTVIAPSDTTAAYARRCPSVNWIGCEPPPAAVHASDSDSSSASDSDSNSDSGGGGTVILSVEWLERQDAPDREMIRLRRLVEQARCGLIVSVARDRRWGASHFGPPPQPEHRQEWTADEIGALCEAAGLDVVHRDYVPADADRRELTSVATIVVSRVLAPADRARVREVAVSTLSAYLAERAQLSAQALSGALVSDAPPLAPVVVNPSVPSAHVLLDDALVSVYGRAPLEDARRWTERIEPLDGAPLVIFGLGLGYHALAAANRPGSGRVVVVEPFERMVHTARTTEAARDALDRGRIEVVRDWRDFSALVRRDGLDLSRARFADVPGYARLAGDTYTTFVTLFEGARAWDRAGLGHSVKPFCHEAGISVVISTYNRQDTVRLLIEDLAHQRPCGAPVEVLLVNDDGDTAGFASIRDAARAGGLDLRLFDTHFPGYGLTLARNIGLRFARYDTTVFLDDDLRIAPDMLWHYRQAPESIRAGRIDAEFDDGGVRRARPDPRAEMRGREARVLRPWNAHETFLWGGNCAVTTELGLALGGFDETFLGEGEEDTDFGARAVRATHRPVAVPGAAAQHEGLDQTTRAWLGFTNATRPGRSRALLADTARGNVVNGGIAYWSGSRWAGFVTPFDHVTT